MADLDGGEIIHRVRAELAPHRRELKLYALCRCGSGAWLVSIAPFEELFFDERLVCGLTVCEALERLWSGATPPPAAASWHWPAEGRRGDSAGPPVRERGGWANEW